MYTQALESLIFIGNLKVILTAIGWISALSCISLWLLQGFYDFNSKHGRKIIITITIILTLMWPACITVYTLPSLREEIVIAKQVAPILDKYAENNPESVYNPDVLLGAVDTTIQGIVNSAVELPKYIARLASGQLIVTQKRAEDMTREELLRRVRELENK